MDIEGYMGAITTARGEQEACIVETATWSTQCWEETDAPTVGDAITLGSAPSWYVTETSRSGCFVVLKLCRAVIACPDCLSSIYSMERIDTNVEYCDKELDPVRIASDVPTTVCPLEAQVDQFGDAEVVSRLVLICLEGTTDVQPGMVISCETNSYRVVKIRQKCSGSCLTTVEAELDTLGLLALN